MAKTNMLMREKHREALAKKYAAKRAKLRETIRNPRTDPEVRADAQAQLQKLPRDSNPNRQRNRCAITGRSRGVYRKFGLGRSKLREATMKGEIPGLGKASW
jgi:small subunit ribosomal protein S14